MNKKKAASVVVLLFGFALNAQNQPLTVEQTLELALQNNAELKAANLTVDAADALVSNAFTFDKTQVYYSYDQNNLAANNEPLKVFGVAQDFKFPTVYFAEKKVNKAKVLIEKSNYELQLQRLKRAVYSKYYQLNYAHNRVKAYQYLDSLYRDFSKKAERRFQLGESNYLEMISARSKQKQMQTMYLQAIQTVVSEEAALKNLVQTDSINIIKTLLMPLPLESISTANHPGLSYFKNLKTYKTALTKSERQSLLPDLSAEYFQGTNSGINNNFIGYQFGLKIPLFFSGQRSKIKAAKIAENIVAAQQNDFSIKLNAKHQSLEAQLKQHQEALDYYNTEGQQLSEELIKTANTSYKEGDIDFFQYIQTLETATDIQLEYLDALNQYNQTVIQINYLSL